MPVERHAITASARRAAFWPSIARASAQLDVRCSLRRWQPDAAGDPAVLGLVKTAAPSTARAAGGSR